MYRRFGPGARDPAQRGKGGVSVRGGRYVDCDAAQIDRARDRSHVVLRGSPVEPARMRFVPPGSGTPMASRCRGTSAKPRRHAIRLGILEQSLPRMPRIATRATRRCDRARVRAPGERLRGRWFGADRAVAVALAELHFQHIEGRQERLRRCCCTARSFGLRSRGGLAGPRAPPGRPGRCGH